jgi:16S rRNA (cytidine1402-2'-O)-methyltransferase
MIRSRRRRIDFGADHPRIGLAPLEARAQRPTEPSERDRRAPTGKERTAARSAAPTRVVEAIAHAAVGITTRGEARRMSGRLAIVATPIGNLGDLSERAIAELRDADLVLAEDTRRTRALLTHLGIAGKALERLDAHAEEERVAPVLARLMEGARVALVSDAGTPAISDPGARLVRAAAAAGCEVTALPGPSAVTTAIAASGFGGERFRFFGFLPRKKSALARTIADIAATDEVVVAFEAPARMAETLAELARSLGDRPAVVARELSKKHEEYLRGTLAELATAEREWRGEITLVIGPAPPRALATEADIDARIAELPDELPPRDAAKLVAAETGWSARDVYARLLAARRG